MKTANLAIVFTDLKGFTERTSRQTLEENERLLESHSRLLRPLFDAFGGRVVKTIGDAFLVTFESPTQAVLCGAAIQDRLWLHNREAKPEERLELRVAVNVGEVRVEGKDVFGEPVNIAARVEGIAQAGEVYFTEAVYLAMNKAEVPSEEVGAFELKGIPGKIKVFKVPHAPYRMEAPDAPVAPPAPPPDTALPPFGNLGLSRVGEASRRRPDPGELVAVAEAQVKAAVSSLKETTTQWVEKAQKGRGRGPGKKVAVAAALGVVLSAGAVFLLTRSEVQSAIDEVASASDQERPARVARAEALIRELEEPKDKALYRARLHEARGDPRAAVRAYADAARLGASAGGDALVDLLEHEKCEVRSAAAERLGALRWKKAKGALEDLAEAGGPDDQEGGGVLGQIFGCNSKRAAAEALERVE